MQSAIRVFVEGVIAPVLLLLRADRVLCDGRLSPGWVNSLCVDHLVELELFSLQFFVVSLDFILLERLFHDFDCVLDASEFLEIILEFLVCDLVLPEEIGLWDFILEGVYDLPRVDVFDFRLREIEQLLLIHV